MTWKIAEVTQQVVKWWKQSVIYVLFLILMAGTIACKQNYYIDELFSYGLANHTWENGESISPSPKLAPHTYESGGAPFYEYLTVQPGKRFDFVNVWRNQIHDVHPPLYYLTLHFVCSFFPSHFTKWFAGGINIFFALLTLVGVRGLARELGCGGRDRDIISLFVVFSPVMLRAVTYFRMYVMLMCEMTWLTCLIMRWRGRECRRFYVMSVALSVAGALTHYYFLIYLFFISLFYGMSLLAEKAYEKMAKYCGGMFCAGVLSCLMFPAILTHIFGGGYRGKEAFANLGTGLERYESMLNGIFQTIDEAWFGKTLAVLMVLMMLYFGLKILRGGGRSFF